MWVYIGTSELKNAYIGEVEWPLKLKQIFDFSVDTTFWDYTYYKSSWNWVIIDNANWCCRTDGYNCSAMVYKSINAKACWLRILFDCTWAVNGNIQLWPFSWQNWIPSWATVDGILENQSSNKRLRIYYYWANSYANYTISDNTDYYLDLYYENWLYTVSLIDASMNVLQSLTKQDTSWHTTMPYSWFAMWNDYNTYQWRVKKYREDYKV